jgi:methyltransferase (TIGR00027 family)
MVGGMSELTAVNRTAFGVAAIRAAETRRPDALFRDPHAAVLIDSAPPRPPATSDADREQRRRLVAHVIVRTRFYDDLLLAAASPQVVILGAGLDARAWRLDWPPGTTVWELDQPAVLAHKAARLPAPPVDRREVAVDLRADWPASLARAGHDPTEPTAWLAEGLFAYLETPDIRRLLEAVTERSAAGSVIGCERSSGHQRLARTVSALWAEGLPEGAAAELRQLGWEVEETSAATLARHYGRSELASDTGFVRGARTTGA